MKITDMNTIAQRLAKTSGIPVILVDAYNHGGTIRVDASFPSLSDEGKALVNDDKTFLIEFDNAYEAKTAYDTITLDLEKEAELIHGTIRLVRPEGASSVFQIQGR
jgi:hypothetical protein